jgi:hypothetical protein
MKLKLLDRIVLGSLLPKEGKYEDLIVTEDIKKKVGLKQEEIEEYEVKTLDGGGIGWNPIGAQSEFEIEFAELETGVIKKTLEKLNTDEKLTAETIGIYKLFCK